MNDLIIYNSIREQMKTGDGLGFQNTGLIPAIIRWRTKEDGPIPLSHWGGIIRVEAFEGAENRRYTVEAEADGFYPRILSEYIKNYEGHIYYYPLKDEWEPYRNKIGTDIFSMLGRGYDFLGVAKRFFIRVSADARHLCCSEGWQLGYQNTAPHLCKDVGKGFLTPAAMWKLGVFKSPIKII